MNKALRNVVIALSISAALNIFFVGFVVSRIVFKPRPPSAFMMGPGSPFGAARALGKPRMRKLMREYREDFRPKRQALRAARRKVAETLETEPFKPADLEQALLDLRQASNASQETLHKALVDLAKTSTPEERRRLAHTPELRGRRR